MYKEVGCQTARMRGTGRLQADDVIQLEVRIGVAAGPGVLHLGAGVYVGLGGGSPWALGIHNAQHRVQHGGAQIQVER